MRQPVPFGKYLLLDRISVGGMAEVFKAKSYGVEGFEKIIAIKRILPTMGEDRDFIKMFIDEAKIAGQLAHANICQIFELGRIDGSHFIAMEYIWGKDLLQIQNRLRKIKQPMPVAMACFSIAKVLEGLDYAHRKRDPLGRPLEIVHRDCSPQNVLVSYEGEVKVIDFGIAKATSRNSRTMAGVLKGKFGYMSPEQVRGLPLDRRSDIFALGTMLYECLTSDRLFQGETDFSTLEKVRNVDIRPPREINPNIPEAVERVILKALARDVDDRYQWCSEMLADLQAYLMSQDVVFTAKSLSSWLKEVFATEIDRERALLEQYKRVGRDGLIAGVPSAEAKLDVVEHLGEAPAPEGDATQLGGPNFDDLEQAVAAGASVELGPAPGSPAARGRQPSHGDDDGDFGEEAPTEIFGEIDHGPKPTPAAPPQAAAPPRPPARVPTASVPPKPPPLGRPGSSRPSDPPYPQPAAAAPPNAPMRPLPGVAPMVAPMAATGGDGMYAATASQPAASPAFVSTSFANPSANAMPPLPPASDRSSPNPLANNNNYGAYTPSPQLGPAGGPPAPLNAATGTPPNAQGVAPGQNGRTLMGAAAPPGLPNYANWQPGQPPPVAPQSPQGYPQEQQQQYGMGSHPPSHPSQPQMQQHPSQPQMQQHPSQPQMQQQPSQPQILGGYQQPQQPFGNYGGYNSNYSQQGYGQPQPPQHQSQPLPQFQGTNPNVGSGGYGAQPPAATFHPPGAHNPQQQYGTGPAVAIDAPAARPMAPVEGRKKSSIGRDVAIGVLIAAVVLGGFLAVKFLILDSDDSGSSSSGDEPAASITKVKIQLPAGVKAKVELDGKDKAQVVENGHELDISTGAHKLKLIGRNAPGTCEKEITLEADKVNDLDCPLTGSGGNLDEKKDGEKKDGEKKDGEKKDEKASDKKDEKKGAATMAAGSNETSTSVTTDKEVKAEDKKAEEKKVEEKKKAEDKRLADEKKQADELKKPDDKKTEEDKKKAEEKRLADEKKKKLEEQKKKDEEAKKAAAGKKGIDSAIDGALETKKPDKGSAATPAVDDKGFISLFNKDRPARIAIDDIDTGLSTPVTKLPLTVGRHKITFSFKTEKHTFTVFIKAGATETLSKEF